MTEARAWVLLRSKRRFDLLNPTPFDWELADLAEGEARTFRWGGSSAWEWPLSVAQHSLLTLEIHRAAAPTGLSPALELANLVHDGAEALGVRWDPITPVKPFLGDGFHKMDRAIQRAIHIRLGLPADIPVDWKKAIKHADRRAAAAEALHIAGWSREEIRSTLKIRLAPLAEDPLQRRYGGTAWEPWPMRVAEERFLAELERLLHRHSLG
ncbi:phosphohydrolase [Magnetospirillum sulfuroxidans]|nr:phosphohydrolase [Magnetospirillum sulfuroxidans]